MVDDVTLRVLHSISNHAPLIDYVPLVDGLPTARDRLVVGDDAGDFLIGLVFIHMDPFKFKVIRTAFVLHLNLLTIKCKCLQV